MRIERTVIAGLCAVALPAAAAPAWLNAARIEADIQSQGAKAVVDRLWHTPTTDPERPTRWDLVADQIAAGRPNWIALAPRLAAGTDAGASEDLGIALAHALPLAPMAVLKAIDPANGPAIGVDRVCSAPFIEDTVKDLPGYIRSAEAALATVRAPDLAPTKQKCLTALHRAAAAILNRSVG